jgi:hypothetical protein
MTMLVDYHATFRSKYIHFRHCEEQSDEAIQPKIKISAASKNTANSGLPRATLSQ